MFTSNNRKTLSMALALTGLIAGSSVAAWSAPLAAKPGVTVLAREGDDYCHLQYPAMDPATLGDKQPQLKEWASGDIVDYYGPCDHDPTSKEDRLEEVRAINNAFNDGE
jgi:hypothetical protein